MPRKPKLRSLPFVVLACGSGVGLLGKLPLLRRLLPLPIPILVVGCMLLLCLPFAFSHAVRFRKLSFAIFVVGLVVTELVVLPRMQALHAIGHGSDQADCVIVAAKQMTNGRWPYDARLMRTHNAMSCGPGWVMLEVPLLALTSYGVSQLCLVAACLVVVWRSAGGELTMAFGSLLLLCPGLWLCAADGSDFLPFGVLVAMLCVVAKGTALKRWQRMLVSAISCLLFQFRAPFVVMPGLFSRRFGRARVALVGLVGIAMELGFFFWNPVDFIESGPMHLLAKSVGKNATHLRFDVLGAAVAFALVLLLMVCIWAGEHLEVERGVLLYLAAWLCLPAAIDLCRKCLEYPSLTALGVWEGGPWLAACLPTAALMCLAGREQRVKPVVEQSPGL